MIELIDKDILIEKIKMWDIDNNLSKILIEEGIFQPIPDKEEYDSTLDAFSAVCYTQIRINAITGKIFSCIDDPEIYRIDADDTIILVDIKQIKNEEQDENILLKNTKINYEKIDLYYAEKEVEY